MNIYVKTYQYEVIRNWNFGLKRTTHDKFQCLKENDQNEYFGWTIIINDKCDKPVNLSDSIDGKNAFSPSNKWDAEPETIDLV